MTAGKIAQKKYIYGIWDHEEPFMDAIDKIRGAGIEITDAYSPFPVHGIDDKLGIKESRLHTSGFLLGLTGTITALSVITWIVTMNYPTVFGGKPFWALPAFIPIIFESTILFACWGMFFVYIIRNELYPGFIPMIIDERTTDDKFALAFGIDHSSAENVNKINAALKDAGALEIHTKEFN